MSFILKYQKYVNKYSNLKQIGGVYLTNNEIRQINELADTPLFLFDPTTFPRRYELENYGHMPPVGRQMSNDDAYPRHSQFNCSGDINNLVSRINYFLNNNQKNNALNLVKNCIIMRSKDIMNNLANNYFPDDGHWNVYNNVYGIIKQIEPIPPENAELYMAEDRFDRNNRSHKIVVYRYR